MNGNINVRQNMQITQAHTEQVREKAESHNEVLKNINLDLTDLTDEMAGYVKLVKDGSGKKDNVESEKSSKEQLHAQKEFQKSADTQQVKQNQNTSDQFAQQGGAKGNEAVKQGLLDKAVEGMLSEILGNKEVEKKKKTDKLKFEEKLERLSELENDFENMKFDNAEEKETVEKFFENVGRFKGVKNRLKQLSYMEEQLEEQEKKKGQQQQQQQKQKEKEKQ